MNLLPGLAIVMSLYLCKSLFGEQAVLIATTIFGKAFFGR